MASKQVEDESKVNPVDYQESIEQNGIKLKEEFGKSIQDIIDKLVEKREAVYDRIDEIVRQGCEDMKRKENEAEQIHRVRRSISSEMEGRTSIYNKLMESLNEEISIVELKVPSIKIKWNYPVEKFIQTISKLADVEKCYKSPYKLKNNPIWTGITQGKGESELVKPGGVAVDPETNDIYIGDRGSPKILVFAKNGEYKRLVPVQNKHNMISRICIFKTFIFFISEVLQTPLYKVRKDNGVRIVKQVYPGKMNRITMDNSGNVFMCNDSELTLYSCNVELGSSNQKKLTSPYFKRNILSVTRLLDIKALAKEIYCLFNNTEMPIHVFSSKGELIRPIQFSPTPLSINTNLASMHIDKSGKILMNYGVKNEGGIMIYHPEGELLKEIGKQGKGKGEVIDTREVVVVEDTKTVIICNANPLNMLVAY